MPLEKHNILDLAENHLRTSIILFLAGQDLVSAITLAGAADVILCRLVENQGLENFTLHVLASENNPEKTVETMGNEINDMFCINALKHMDSMNDDTVKMNLRENAVGAILKALPNYKDLRGLDHDFIQCFLSWIRNNLDRNKYNTECDLNWKAKT